MTGGSGQSSAGPPPPAGTARRVAAIEALIPAPPPDVAPLRLAFSRMVSEQWAAHVSTVPVSAKARFIAQAYARACYSMLLVSAAGPAPLRLPLIATAKLPLSRGVAIPFGGVLLRSLSWMVPRAVHRQLLLVSTLMGTLDGVLDATASSGKAAALRISSLIARQPPANLSPAEQTLVTLAQSIRRAETVWQSDFWETVLQPAVRSYCLAEALAVAHAPDPTGMGHRWAGIDAVIKGMWYVVGPRIGLRGGPSRFAQPEWNREQQWMASTSMLLQMIDDWVDQDEDRGLRLTPVVTGEWTPKSVDDLYRNTIRDLTALLSGGRIQNPVMQQLFIDLYNDYLHLALDGMRAGVAA